MIEGDLDLTDRIIILYEMIFSEEPTQDEIDRLLRIVGDSEVADTYIISLFK